MPRLAPKTPATRRPPRLYTLWVTRDSDPKTGRLRSTCDAWFARPTRIAADRGALWYAPGGMADRAAVWDLADCRRYAGTLPEDDRQCLRIEGDVVRDEVAA